MDYEKLKKVARLARYGSTDGERNAATSILEHFGCRLDDIDTEEKQVYVQLRFKDAFEKKLIFQTVARLTNLNSIDYFKDSSRCISVKISASKAERLKQDVVTVLSSWRKEIKKFQISYIHTQCLYSDSKGGGNDADKLSEDEILEILAMAKGIQRVTLVNQIGPGKSEVRRSKNAKNKNGSYGRTSK
jgi:hypothetical protein